MNNKSDCFLWLTFDGPSDALWVENLNTVLDDNRILCLGNGQRIKLPLNFYVLFELTDLKHTTPATITRCGMIYIDKNTITWQPLY